MAFIIILLLLLITFFVYLITLIVETNQIAKQNAKKLDRILNLLEENNSLTPPDIEYAEDKFLIK